MSESHSIRLALSKAKDREYFVEKLMKIDPDTIEAMADIIRGTGDTYEMVQCCYDPLIGEISHDMREYATGLREVQKDIVKRGATVVAKMASLEVDKDNNQKLYKRFKWDILENTPSDYGYSPMKHKDFSVYALRVHEKMGRIKRSFQDKWGVPLFENGESSDVEN